MRTRPQSMVINRATTSQLVLRKPNPFFFGVWYDAEILDHTFWHAFGGRSVRFIWRFD